MNELSKRQKEYMENYAPEVSASSRYNIKSGIKRKLMEIEYFLAKFLKYPIAEREFSIYLEQIREVLYKEQK